MNEHNRKLTFTIDIFYESAYDSLDISVTNHLWLKMRSFFYITCIDILESNIADEYHLSK